MRALVLALSLVCASVAPAAAQRTLGPVNQQPAAPAPAPAAGAGAGESRPAMAAFCEALTTSVVQAEQMLRQMAVAVNAAIRTEPPSQTIARTAWMDHWVGRLSALIEASVPVNCMEEARLEAVRRSAAQYGAFAAQAREAAQRPPEAAPPPPARVTQRRQQRDQQRQELQQQQSLLP